MPEAPDPSPSALVPRPSVGRAFEEVRRVRLADVSPAGRLRLDAATRYLQDLSADDTADAALPDAESWVVRKTVIEVQQFPRYLEALEMATWCSGIGSHYAERRISIVGERGGAIEAATTWVHVDAGSGRPKRVSEGFTELYGEAAAGRRIKARLTHDPLPDGEVDRAPWPLRFTDFEGLGLELVIAHAANVPLQATHPHIPAQFAITGIEGARAYSSFANVEERLLTDTLGFSYSGEGRYRLDGDGHSVNWTLDQPTHRGVPGAGTVHHIAWASADADHLDWQRRISDAGGFVTDVQDRDYFDAIYFREPRGVLFEIATVGPGFATDESPEHLGEELRVPKMHAALRDELEATLTPLTDPTAAARTA